MNGASCTTLRKRVITGDSEKFGKLFWKQLATADNTPDFIEVPSSAIQSENIAPNHKTVAMIRGRNHLTLEITDQVSASFLNTLLGVMMDAQ